MFTLDCHMPVPWLHKKVILVYSWILAKEIRPMSTKKKPFNFEKSINELETIVETMESEALSLEESLKLFEKGIGLTRDCQKALQEAEQKVEKLMVQDGQIITTPFYETDEEADD